ncbi:MAG: hypothetical protein AAFX93_11745 [Verrucomicrobiota bacterium]
MGFTEDALGTPQFPGLLGMIECDEAGNILHSEGDDAEALGQVLVFMHQISDLIGESFGLDGLEEGHFIGKHMTAVCVPRGGSDLGVLFESKANISEILPSILEG